jgi:hypothetical protein
MFSSQKNLRKISEFSQDSLPSLRIWSFHTEPQIARETPGRNEKMLTTDSEKPHPPRKETTVNKAALTSWLHAWTTGTSFSTPLTAHRNLRPVEKMNFTVLRQIRLRREKE